MLSMFFAQSEVDHASHAEEVLRHLLARVQHEGNRPPKDVLYMKQQHALAVRRHAEANQRLDEIVRDRVGRSWWPEGRLIVASVPEFMPLRLHETHLGANETGARADAIPPPNKTILTTEKTHTFGCQSEKGDHRRSVKIG
jgi:hypothetical protein